MSFLVYKSSAGSGKTFTLVKEYLKLALGTDDPMVFSHILAITFTNKAANEMTDRILETLEEMSGVKTPMQGRTRDLLNMLAKDLDIDSAILVKRSRVTLKKIVHNYREFSVGTIDSFVHRVIRSFATEMGLNQQFEVELNTESVLKRAVDLMLDRVGVDKTLTKFIEQYIDSKFDEGQTWKIDEDLFDYSRGLLNTHEWYYLNKAKAISLEKYATIYSELAKEVRTYEQHISGLAKDAYALGLDGVEIKSYASRGVLINYFKKILNKDYQPDYGSTIQKLMENDSSKWFAAKAPDDEKALIESKRPTLWAYLDDIEKYRKIHQSNYVFQKLLLSNMYRVALLSEIDKYVQQIKKDHDIVLISDFTDLVGEITRNEPVPFIYEKLGERYNHFLFDEFQDTSLMQWHNMLPLVEESLSKRGTSLVVGDAKQSIYRWRGGVVEQFEQLPDVYNPYGDEYVEERKIILSKSNEEVAALATNYRSQENIIQFNNLFFEKSAETLGGSAAQFYTDVKQGVHHKGNLGLVHFEFFYGKKKEDSMVAIFAQIAELILQLQEEKFKLKDIAILTKTKSETPALVEYLNAQNINVISSESLLVKNSEAVQLVVATLWYLNQPGETFYISDFLIKLNQISPKADFHSVIRNPKDLDEDKLVQILAMWGYRFNRNQILAFPVYEMVSAIVEIFGLQKLKDNRLASWMDYVFNLSQKTGFGLYDLLDDWKVQNAKLSIQIPEDVDAVNVLTIHKSKGLDWPVVILAQGNWTKKHNKHNIWVDVPDANPLPVMILPTSDQVKDSVFSEEYEKEMQRIQVDNFNALYVAFTRPAERLYVMTIKPEADFFGEVMGTLYQMEGHELVNTNYTDVDGKSLIKTFSYGTEQRAEQEESDSIPEIQVLQLSNLKNSLYRDKLKVKKNYLKWMNDSGERDYGNLVHKAFSFINDEDDIAFAMEQLVNTGDIEKEEVDALVTLIKEVIHHPQLSQYFNKGLEVKNEADLVLANGDLLRPDRVVIDGEDACVIDFKTGMRKPEHEQQIVSYKIQLEKMGYENVKSLLIYTHKLEVVEV
ncbi:MAG: ATP-dependent exoDNAse (exonuclease V) beta subunit [Salibacteraceae bacterium]|jgi:ATP-dependent exoDNAse (exonuclease V) beta subunit